MLLIAGSGRSGSTLLDVLMAGIDGCVAVGELRYIWERGLVQDRLCGCGERFSACPFWAEVLRTAFRGDTPDPRRMMALQDRGTRMRNLPATFGRGSGTQRLAEYPAAMATLIRAIATVADATTVVDSSKLPPYGAILRVAPGVDLRVVHLVRDPRATAFSWGQRKELTDREQPALMQQQRAAKAAALWATWNVAAEALGRGMRDRYLRLRYEDFIATPAPALAQVTALIGRPEAALPLTESHRAKLSPSHTVAGNPDRFHDGDVELRMDERWQAGLSGRDRVIVTAIAAPLMLRYRYPMGTA